MIDEKLKLKLEDLKIEQKVIDEIMNESIENKKLSVQPSFDSSQDKIFDLETELENTPKADWRKRASISARIISVRLD